MDAISVHEQLIGDYRAFTSGFVDIRDRRLAAHVAERLDSGAQWPDPWVSLNPNFAAGGTDEELVAARLQHPECARVFRVKERPADPVTTGLRSYQHQREAIEAVHRAVTATPRGLTQEIVAQHVTGALGLDLPDFAQSPDAKFSAKNSVWRALREVVGYRLYVDLQRGWRITMPNLEQTGLLRVDYIDLTELAEDQDSWAKTHHALCEDTAGHRRELLDLYRDMAATLSGMHAHEHTAQVPDPDRERREKDFSSAALPLLFCSPTMELGVDIASLNAVGLHNIPPTPANYAQPSGRAGRAGHPALVVTYCATGNAHDQYYFRRSQDMVAGSVAAPRLDLTNEDLLRSHLHALWLAEIGQSLRSSLSELLDVSGEEPTLALLPEIAQTFAPTRAQRAGRPRPPGARRDHHGPHREFVVARRVDRPDRHRRTRGVRRGLRAVAQPVPGGAGRTESPEPHRARPVRHQKGAGCGGRSPSRGRKNWAASTSRSSNCTHATTRTPTPFSRVLPIETLRRLEEIIAKQTNSNPKEN